MHLLGQDLYMRGVQILMLDLTLTEEHPLFGFF